MKHFVDRLLDRCREVGPICVGIDPVYDRLPDRVTGTPSLSRNGPIHVDDALRAIDRFVAGVLKTIAPHVACVKIQSGCYERYRWRGVRSYEKTIELAKKLGLIVIADAKRGDIGVSAAHYAAGCLADPEYVDPPHLDPPNTADPPVPPVPPGSQDPSATAVTVLGPDALTINSYFGPDSIDPFLEVATREHKGLFALVRTSNPGSDLVQNLKLDGGHTVAQAVGNMIARLGMRDEYLGDCGYSLLGAVVAATKPHDAAVLRQIMPQQLFLVPGYGTQGGSPEDIKPLFKDDGSGALITASRSITYAYQQTETEDWVGAIEEATITMKRQINTVLHG